VVNRKPKAHSFWFPDLFSEESFGFPASKKSVPVSRVGNIGWRPNCHTGHRREWFIGCGIYGV
jgi:hypothetical protein